MSIVLWILVQPVLLTAVKKLGSAKDRSAVDVVIVHGIQKGIVYFQQSLAFVDDHPLLPGIGKAGCQRGENQKIIEKYRRSGQYGDSGGSPCAQRVPLHGAGQHPHCCPNQHGRKT